MKINQPEEQLRKAEFTTRPSTKIWDEKPSDKNPYLAEHCRCHGYDLLELIQKRSFVDVLYLLFLGELPSAEQAKLLETLLIGFINPGPRHPATRAAMNLGVSRTKTVHILPIGLSVLGGEYLGASEVEAAMRFLRTHQKTNPEKCLEDLLTTKNPSSEERDCHIAPGFGSHFGDIDPLPQKIAAFCKELPGSGKALKWGDAFAKSINSCDMGWLCSGVCAAVLCDLGFHPRLGSGFFQFMCSPGLLAHGLEMANKPITAMPFWDKEHYVIESKTRPEKD